MNINDVARVVAVNEGLKKEVNIAQIREILRVINTMTNGEFYKLLRRI